MNIVPVDLPLLGCAHFLRGELVLGGRDRPLLVWHLVFIRELDVESEGCVVVANIKVNGWLLGPLYVSKICLKHALHGIHVRENQGLFERLPFLFTSIMRSFSREPIIVRSIELPAEGREDQRPESGKQTRSWLGCPEK